jgi:hypothetical protein
MATGRLGTANLATATNTTVYTVPGTTFSVVTVSICNRTNTAITCRIALSTSTTPAADEWIEYDTEILPKGVLERTGLVMQASLNLVVWSSSSSVTAVAMGIETPTA